MAVATVKGPPENLKNLISKYLETQRLFFKIYKKLVVARESAVFECV